MPTCFVNEKEKERLLGIKPKYLLSSEIYDPDTTDYLTITSLEGDNVLTIRRANKSSNYDIYYNTQKFKEGWKKVEWESNKYDFTINFSNTIYLYGENPDGISTSSSYFLQLSCSKGFECSGNIMTLIQRDGNINTIPNDYCFYKLFSSDKLKKASNLKLPATTLTSYCYSNMFSGCTTLIDTPLLTATTLADYCYENMFQGCAALTTAPYLPATTLVDTCYGGMFSGCTSLVNVPELPATILAHACYKQMFSECTSLTVVPELPVMDLAPSCYREMFSGCTSLTEAPELPATVMVRHPQYTYEGCYLGMFKNCTSLTQAPELPAMTLEESCYYQMFQGCTSLTTAPELPATTMASDCYGYMFNGCTSLIEAPELSSTELAGGCYEYMFQRCYSLVEAPDLPATTLKGSCYKGMFAQCLSLTRGPELLATVIPTHAYELMFADINNSKLEYLKILAEDISAYQAAANMFRSTSPSYGFFFGTTTVGIPGKMTYCVPDDTVDVNSVTETLTITTKGDTSSIFTKIINTGSGDVHASFSFDKVHWYYMQDSRYISLKKDKFDSVYIIGEGERTNTNYFSIQSTSNANYSISGNLKAILNYKDLSSQLTPYCYKSLFSNSNSNTEFLFTLPDMTLAPYCYSEMFANCQFTTFSIQLPATTLADHCYYYMFYQCSNLTTTPDLPATTLADYCYYLMFYQCKALTTFSTFSATTLAPYCCHQMFYNCTALVTVPVQLPATTLSNHCYDSMFYNCASLVNAPTLPAITLTEGCYYSMFYGCSILNKVITYAQSATGSYYLTSWLRNVAATGDFYNLGGYTFSSGYSGIPSGWTEHTTLPE